MKPDLRIDWATHQAAEFACKNWHYSQCLPVGKIVRVGAWENDKFIGVVLFSRGAAPKLSLRYNLGQDQCVELTRIALTDHITPVSRIMAIALKFLKKRSPNLRLVVSFADPNQDHYGGIYQAGNWIYTGRSDDTRQWLINGKVRHPRTVGSQGRPNSLVGAKMMDPNARAIYLPGKFRYLMPLDDGIRATILPMAKPYPKRAKDQEPGNPPGLGGETPTCALHIPGAADG